MSCPRKTVAKMKKTVDLTNLAFHKNGPKSFKQGVGALVVALDRAEGSLTNRELVDVLGMGRKGVKTIVKKAMRSELVAIEGVEGEKKTYRVVLTEEGAKVATKRAEADKAVAEQVLAGVTEEELEQLTAICDKIILNIKEMGINGKKHKAYRHNHRCRKHAPKHAAKKCCCKH